jgi:hypothetical protein
MKDTAKAPAEELASSPFNAFKALSTNGLEEVVGGR